MRSPLHLLLATRFHSESYSSVSSSLMSGWWYILLLMTWAAEGEQREFPGGSVLRTPHFYCCGPGLRLGGGTKRASQVAQWVKNLPAM